MPLALQHVADAAHRLDETRRARFIFDLLAQVTDIHLDDIGLAHEVVAPDAIQDGLAIKHLAWMGHEEMEQIEFGRRQFDNAAIAFDLVRGLVQREIIDGEDAPAGAARLDDPLLATQQRPHRARPVPPG